MLRGGVVFELTAFFKSDLSEKMLARFIRKFICLVLLLCVAMVNDVTAIPPEAVSVFAIPLLINNIKDEVSNLQKLIAMLTLEPVPARMMEHDGSMMRVVDDDVVVDGDEGVGGAGVEDRPLVVPLSRISGNEADAAIPTTFLPLQLNAVLEGNIRRALAALDPVTAALPDVRASLVRINALLADAQKADGRPMRLSDISGKSEDAQIPISVLAANLHRVAAHHVADLDQRGQAVVGQLRQEITTQRAAVVAALEAQRVAIVAALDDQRAKATKDLDDQRVKVTKDLEAQLEKIIQTLDEHRKAVTHDVDVQREKLVATLDTQRKEVVKDVDARIDKLDGLVKKYAKYTVGAVIIGIAVYAAYRWYASLQMQKKEDMAAILDCFSLIEPEKKQRSVLGGVLLKNVQQLQRCLADERGGLFALTHFQENQSVVLEALSQKSPLACVPGHLLRDSFCDLTLQKRVVQAMHELKRRRIPLVILQGEDLLVDQPCMAWMRVAFKNNKLIFCMKEACEGVFSLKLDMSSQQTVPVVQGVSVVVA